VLTSPKIGSVVNQQNNSPAANNGNHCSAAGEKCMLHSFRPPDCQPSKMCIHERGNFAFICRFGEWKAKCNESMSAKANRRMCWAP